MAPNYQWLKSKLQSNKGKIPPPPYRDEWFIVPSSAPANSMPSNYGPFQTLPLEIRQQILGHAFGNRTLHVDLTYDHPLIRKRTKFWDPSQYKKTIKSALAPHRAPSNAAVEPAHCGFGTHLIRDTWQPKQWQWFSCVCHRPAVREEEDDGPSTRQPRIEPHEDGCIPHQSVDKKLWRDRIQTAWCESTAHNPPPADACFVGVMGWLLACRQAYHEGTDILYRTNTFHFASLPLLLDLPRLIPPAHLAAITSAELLWTFVDPRVLADETMRQIWRDYIDSPSSFPDLSSPNNDFHRLAAQLPASLPNVRRLYIALQTHIPPWGTRKLPPITTTTQTSTTTPAPTSTSTNTTTPAPTSDSYYAAPPICNIRGLAAIEHVIFGPIEDAFRRLGPGPGKEFSLAVQRGGWEVFARWLEKRAPGGGGSRRIFEIFNEAGEGGEEVVSYRERVWKPLAGGGVAGEEGVFVPLIHVYIHPSD
ncbi:hypothetical protein F5144DRAFT_627994 [Chaetomium tenue]|uniref:Uncharacterized protein n=1 Tax=Chaetomium tenue TaxID=1854479 RepID=A0ACB7PES9_9PEZI|nr:hypothetical protein F5144DRAFT_627994 [Chaetomium globosum]